MSKIIKRSIFAFIIFICVIAGLLFFVSKFYSEEAKEVVVTELNKHLDIEVSVADISLSMIENFPQASIVFSDLQTKEKRIDKSGSLLKAKKLSVLFNMYSLVTGKFKIEKILLKDAFLNLIIYDDASNNFTVFKSSNTIENEKLNIDIRKLILQNVQILYINYTSNQEYFFKSENSILSGEFSSLNYRLKVEGHIYSNHIKSGKTIFLKERKLELETEMDINKKENIFKIKSGSLTIEDVLLTYTGNITSKNKSNVLDLHINSNKSKVNSLLKLIPQEFISPIAEYSIKGLLDINADVKGIFKNNQLPFLDLQFKMENGTFKHNSSDVILEDVSFSGVFQNGKSRAKVTYAIRIDNFRSSLKTGYLNGELAIRNFRQPHVSMALQSSIELSQLSDFYQIKELEEIDGELMLNLKFENRLKSFRKFSIEDFISSRSSGTMKISNLNFSLKTSPLSFKNINGLFQFSNKDLLVDKLNGSVLNSDFIVSGKFYNIISYVFLPNEHLMIKAKMSSTNIDLDELLNYKNESNNTGNPLTFSDHLKFDIGITEINKFRFRKFKASNISGRIKLFDKKLFVEDAVFKTMNGSAKLSGIIDGKNSNDYLVNCNASITNVNIDELFYEFGNFGQSKITTENIKGSLNAEIFYKSSLSSFLWVNPASVYTFADITINNGELINYSPLYKLSRFIKKEELEHIHFSTLKNEIEIKDQVVYIPDMDISSNTLDLKLNGSHSFQNEIDYHIQILLSQLLSKDEKANEEIEGIIIEDDGEGKTMLPVRMIGKADDPEIKYDTKTVRKKISSDFKDEKKELKDAFSEEFKWLNKKEKESPQANDSLIIEEGGQSDFLIEWDEPPMDTLDEEQKLKLKTKALKESSSNNEDFIIIWDEEEDTINDN